MVQWNLIALRNRNPKAQKTSNLYQDFEWSMKHEAKDGNECESLTTIDFAAFLLMTLITTLARNMYDISRGFGSA